MAGRLKMKKNSKLFEVYNNHDHVGCHVPVLLDTGASFSLAPFLNDFVDPIKPADVVELKGTRSTALKGVGWVEWHIQDVFGMLKTIRTQAY